MEQEGYLTEAQPPSEPAPDKKGNGEENVMPEEQQAYEEAMIELKDVLYENEQASDALINMVAPEDLVGSTSKTVIQLIAQMDEKINLDESVIHGITEEAVDRLSELVEQTHGVEYSDTQIQQVMMTSWEGVLGVFGGEDEIEPSYRELAASVPEKEIRNAQSKYKEIMNG